MTDAHGADQLGHRPRPSTGQAGTPRTSTWPREQPQWCLADGRLVGRAQSGDPETSAAARRWRSATLPGCDGPAIRAHERAGSDRRRAPEIHGAAGDPRPAAPARARPTAPNEDDSGDTGRRSSTPARSPTGHPRPMASGRCPTPARVEPQGRGLSHRGEGHRSEELSHRGGDRRSLTRGVEEARPRPHRAGPAQTSGTLGHVISQSWI